MIFCNHLVKFFLCSLLFANLEFFIPAQKTVCFVGFKKSKLEPLMHEVYLVQQDLTLPAVFFSYKALGLH